MRSGNLKKTGNEITIDYTPSTSNKMLFWQASYLEMRLFGARRFDFLPSIELRRHVFPWISSSRAAWRETKVIASAGLPCVQSRCRVPVVCWFVVMIISCIICIVFMDLFSFYFFLHYSSSYINIEYFDCRFN